MMADDAPRLRTVNVGGAPKAKPKAQAASTPAGDHGGERKRTPTVARLESRLHDFYAQFGLGLSMFGDPFAGTLIAKRSALLAESWADLAEHDAAVRKALERILEAGAWTGVIAAHASTILPILAVRGVFPENIAQKIMAVTLASDPELAVMFMDSPATGVNGNGA